MDRIHIRCQIQGQLTELQLDKKTMPGETGPCFMITIDGCFKGYISRQKDGGLRPIGAEYFTTQELYIITQQISVVCG